MELTIFINGLLPVTRDCTNGSGGSRVNLIITRGYLAPIKKRRLIADENGEIEFQIPDDYAGGRIKADIMHPWYKTSKIDSIISDYGFFDSAHIRHDFDAGSEWSKSPSSDPEWQSDDQLATASRVASGRARSFKFKNGIARGAYVIAIIGVPLLTMKYIGGIGLFISVVGIGVTEYLVPYSIGMRRFWLQNKP